jgi:N-acetylmuramoyl-L-alanine amidase
MDKLDKITIHWSVTGYTPTEDCYNHYHYIIDGQGNIHNGNRPPESNLESSVKTDTYQEHCGGGNSNNVGVSMASMLGYRGIKNIGNYPITVIQFEECCRLVAKLCKKYQIPVDKDSVFTHYEFGLLNPKTSSAGKIDINFLPPHPQLESREIGDFIRSKVKGYINKC